MVQLAQENRSWGYDRIVGALKHVGYTISDQTVGNILKRHRISPQQLIDAAGVTRVPLPARLPNLNAYEERWVRSVKEEDLSQLIRFGERSLQYALAEYVTHVHQERPHQGKDNVVLMPTLAPAQVMTRGNPIRCRERLGGLLKYDDREAA